MLYRWLVFLHLVGVFGFLLAHGISVSVAFGLRRERDPRDIALLLRVSAGTRSLMYGSLVLLVGGGVAAGVAGSWWGEGWIWAALALLFVLTAVVLVGAAPHFRRLRGAVTRALEGGPAAEDGGKDLARLLGSPAPLIVSAVGGVALVAILYLMVFKPF